ncbi:MAG: hypothetical protein LBK55_00975, partial [Azoarcus sp.]|nr:hypothetical protein [Azoarcus sp.]
NERDLAGGAGNDTLYGGTDANTLMGEAGDDTLYGGAGDDMLIGGEGNDSLYGEAGDDVLIGGTGNDNLRGETGNDTYRFARGDGQDTIYDYDATAGNMDVIEFAEGITADDIWAQRSGSSLILNLAGSTDQVTISSFFSSAAYEIEEVHFADGTTWDQTDLLEIVGIQT